MLIGVFLNMVLYGVRFDADYAYATPSIDINFATLGTTSPGQQSPLFSSITSLTASGRHITTISLIKG